MTDILILLAAYNGEKYLKDQLESIFSQKDVSVYVLVRDDGSTDTTPAILDQYQRKCNLFWYQGEHVGIQRGYYDLMKKASDPASLPFHCKSFYYYAFSDQDDVWDEDKLRLALHRLGDSGESDTPMLYYCGQRLVDENLRFLENHELNRKRGLLTRFVLSDFAGCTGVFNRALLNEVVSFEPKYMLMHDNWIMKVCLCLGGKVIVDPGMHMSYRQHDSNATSVGRRLPALLNQVSLYMKDYQVERQMRELVRGYGKRMLPPYREAARWICGYRKHRAYRKMLLDKNHIDFCSRGLNLIWFLKVCSNRV